MARPIGTGTPSSRALFDHLAEAGGGSTTVATHVDVLREPQKAWGRRIDLVDNATSSIVVTLYCIEGNELGVAYVERLVEAAKRGVNVMVCLDWVAQKAMSGLGGPAFKKQLESAFQALGEAGGVVSYYATPKEHLLHSFMQGNHYKSMIVDGDKAITGGRNVGDSYYKLWSDFELELHGPIVTDLAHAAARILFCANPNAGHPAIGLNRVQQRHHELGIADFLEDVREKAPVLMAEAAAMQQTAPLPRFQFLFHDPTNQVSKTNPITDVMVAAFSAAKQRALATSNYVNPPQRVLNAMTEAAKRGAEVLAVYTSEAGSIVSTLPYYNALYSARQLLLSGAEVRELPVQDHGKMFVFDDVAATGSYNLERAADQKLSECLLLTDDPALVAEINLQIRKSAHTGDIVRERPRNVFQKVAVGIKSVVARLLRGII